MPLRLLIGSRAGRDVAPVALAAVSAPRRDRRGVVTALLAPVGLAIALAIGGSVAFLGWQKWRAEQASLADATALGHKARAVLTGSAAPALRADEVAFVLRQADGRLYRVVAERDAVDRFVNETLVYVQNQETAAQRKASVELTALFERAFADREQSVDGYADWFFAWGTSWRFLWEGVGAALEALPRSVLSPQTVQKSVQLALEDYLLTHYTAFVLKPELRDPVIDQGVRAILQQQQDGFRYTLSRLEERQQRFLAEHTRHVQPLPLHQADGVKLDWDAERWRAARSYAQGRHLESLASAGLVTGSAILLRPAIARLVATRLAGIAAQLALSAEVRAAGAASGTALAPGVGTVVGLLVGGAADYALNRLRDHLDRPEFVAANLAAVNTTMAHWTAEIDSQLRERLALWYGDLGVAVALAR